MTANRTYFLAPQSALMFRSGRPFGATGAVGGDTGYGFPLPGTVAGAMRASWVDASGHQHQQHDQVLMQIVVRGPLRALRGPDGIRPFAPRPLDSAYVGPAAEPMLTALVPMSLKPGDAEGCDLPCGLRPLMRESELEVVDGPEYWSLPLIASWLAGHGIDKVASGHALSELPAHTRIHVRIDGDKLAAVEGGLHKSGGLEFARPHGETPSDQGLLAWLEGPDDSIASAARLDGRHGRLGADGRTAAYEEITEAVTDAVCPNGLASALDDVNEGDTVRLLLVTPACYLRNGWFPDGLKAHPPEEPTEISGSLVGLDGWTFSLTAAAVGRWIPQAGSGMRSATNERGHHVRPLRRLVPAGSVYWLRIVKKGDPSLAGRWLQSTCREEYARDGHGLGIFGVGPPSAAADEPLPGATR